MLNRKAQDWMVKGAYLETNIPVFVTLRVEKGFSRATLAAAAGVDPSYIYRIENGERNPSPKVGKAIAKALGVPMRAIFFIHVADNSQQYATTDVEERSS